MKEKSWFYPLVMTFVFISIPVSRFLVWSFGYIIPRGIVSTLVYIITPLVFLAVFTAIYKRYELAFLIAGVLFANALRIWAPLDFGWGVGKEGFDVILFVFPSLLIALGFLGIGLFLRGKRKKEE